MSNLAALDSRFMLPVSGNLGRTRTFTNIGQRETLLDARMTDGVARVMSVVLKNSIVGQFGGQVALIKFGNEGFQGEAWLDFAQGTCFSVCAAFLRVDGYSLIVPAAAPTVTRLGAFVVNGAGTTTPLPLARFANTPVGIGATVTITTIPPYTREVRVLTDDNANDSFELEFRHAAGLEYNVSVPAGTLMPWTDMANFIDRVAITNTGPAGINRAVFLSRVKLS